MKNKPADFVIRLQEEKNDLHGKLNRLEKFIGSDNLDDPLTEKELFMLMRQRWAMNVYYCALNQRLAFYETGEWPFAEAK